MESFVDLRRQIDRVNSHLVEWQGGHDKTRLRTAVKRMKELLVASGSEATAREREAVARFEGLLNTDCTVTVPGSVKMALASNALTAEQKAALVQARAKDVGSLREKAASQLFSASASVNKKAQSDASAATARPARVQWDAFERSLRRDDREGADSGLEGLDASTTKELLEFHEMEQERITEDMVAASILMHRSAMAINETLKGDEGKLKELGNLQTETTASMTREKDRIRSQTSKTCSTTWYAILMCIIVTLVFVWCVIFIKMFSKRK